MRQWRGDRSIGKRAMRHNINLAILALATILTLCYSSSAFTATCGNGGIPEFPEACDDGNVSWGVGNCAADCTGINTVNIYTSPDFPYKNSSLLVSYSGGLDAQAIGEYFCGNTNYNSLYAITTKPQYIPKDTSVPVSWLISSAGQFGYNPSANGGIDVTAVDNIFCKYPIDHDPPQISLTLAPAATDLTRVTFEGMAVDQITNVSEVFYQIDGLSWVSIPRCGGDFKSKSTIFSIVTSELSGGQHTISFKASDVQGNMSIPLVQTVNVNPPAGTQNVAITYDDNSLLKYKTTPYNDLYPEENLHLYEMSSPAREIPIVSRDKNIKNVQAKVGDFVNNYVLLYKSPACLKKGQ